MKSSGKPQCPNHKVDLTQCGFPIPQKGQGVCPVSGATFAFEADVGSMNQEIKLDAQGNPQIVPQWKITGSD